MRPDCLGVIGLGALGGSVAWRAARCGVPRIVGWSRSLRDGVAAAKAGAIHDLMPSVEDVARQADLLVLAAPAGANERLLAHLAECDLMPPACTDVGSVKQGIVERARQLGLGESFAGSHPFCGTHRSGFAGASADRINGATVYVCPVPGSDGAVSEIEDFWTGTLGAVTVRIEATLHDRMLAATSHLPQVVASALASTLGKASPTGASLGPGAVDTTRLAESDPGVWLDILRANRNNVLEVLATFDDVVREFREALESGDPDRITAWLTEARESRKRMRS